MFMSYINRGWTVLPAPQSFGGKAVKIPGWQNWTLDDSRSACFTETDNIGLSHGPSKTTDVDLDCDEARILAPHYLPLTSTFGRQSTPASHWLYLCAGQNVKFKWPVKQGGKPHILEVLGEGAQSIVPPSLHVESGETVEWDGADNPAPVQYTDLLNCCRRLAAASLVLHYWGEGSRDESAAALSGMLVKGGWTPAEIEDWLSPILDAAGDEEAGDRLKKPELAEANLHGKGGRQLGFTRLAELWGKDVAECLKQWLVKEDTKTQFPMTRASDFVAQGRRGSWLIKHVLPAGKTLTVVYGAPGSGKSFMVLDMACHVARGIEWRDHKTEQGSVVYICCEGSGGFSDRIRAYNRQYGGSDMPLYVISKTPNFLPGSTDYEGLVESISTVPDVKLVVVDTLSRTIAGGNENSPEVITSAIAQCELISDKTGAAVILVHHTGKDSTKGARGHSSLLGAADAEYMVEGGGGDNWSERVFKNTKLKDGEDGRRWGWKLAPVELGVDEDGEKVLSCCVEVSGLPLPQPSQRKATKALLSAFDVLGGGEVPVAALKAKAKDFMDRGTGEKDRRGTFINRDFEEACSIGLFVKTPNGVVLGSDQ